MGVAVFFTSTRIIQLARGVFAVAALPYAVIRFGASLQIRFTNAFFKKAVIIWAEVDRILYGVTRGLGIAFFFATFLVI